MLLDSSLLNIEGCVLVVVPVVQQLIVGLLREDTGREQKNGVAETQASNEYDARRNLPPEFLDAGSRVFIPAYREFANSAQRFR